MKDPIAAFQGAFSSVSANDLGAAAIQATIARAAMAVALM